VPAENDQPTPPSGGIFEPAAVERLPDGALALGCGRIRLGRALVYALALPALLGGAVLAGRLRQGSFPDDPFMCWLGALALAACFLVPAFFAFRWRRVALTPEELVLETRWRGGLRRSRRFPWAEVVRLGTVDWDDPELGPALGVETADGRRFLLPLGGLDGEFDALIESLAGETPLPDSARGMLREALAERRAYRDEHRPMAAGGLPPKGLWKGLVENEPERLRFILPAGRVPARALKIMAAPAAAALACVLGLVWGGRTAPWLLWGGAAVAALAVGGLVLVLLSREEVDAFPDGLSVGRGLFGARRRELRGRPDWTDVFVDGVRVGLGDDRSCVFGAALSAGTRRWVWARLASVWNLEWFGMEEDVVYELFRRPGATAAEPPDWPPAEDA
jgi:hypothetical protein